MEAARIAFERVIQKQAEDQALIGHIAEWTKVFGHDFEVLAGEDVSAAVLRHQATAAATRTAASSSSSSSLSSSSASLSSSSFAAATAPRYMYHRTHRRPLVHHVRLYSSSPARAMTANAISRSRR